MSWLDAAKKIYPVVIAVLITTLLSGTELFSQKVLPEGRAPAAPPGRSALNEALEDIRVRIARVKYGGGGDWYSDPSSLPNLLRAFEKRTGIPTAREEKVIELTDPGLASYPFLYMTGHGNIKLTDIERDRLRNYLLSGGFLYADDNYGMDRAFRRMVREVFPDRELVLVPPDHSIYHCFYDLEGPPKIHVHDGKHPQGFGIFNGDRLILFYTYESDVGDGLEDPDVHGDPPEKREQAMKMAVNVLYYALTR